MSPTAVDPADVRAGRRLAARRALRWLVPATVLGALGVALMAVREAAPIVIGSTIAAGGVAMVWAGLSGVRDVRRWDRTETRRLRAERVPQPDVPRLLWIEWRLLDGASQIGTCVSLRPPKLDGSVRLVAGPGELAMLVDAQGRRTLVFLGT